jgi:electron transport complex protein RnfE
LNAIAQEFTRGIVRENPIFRLVLGMCPTLAVSVTLKNSLGMGFSVLAVLLCSNIVISAVRNIIPDKVRIPAYIMIIATFVTLVEMVLNAFVPELFEALGIFIPLIVVNCILLGRAEAFARKNTIGRSIIDALGIGLGYTISLSLLASIRELFGAGTIFGYQVLGTTFEPMGILAVAPGAFITLGILMGLFNYLFKRLGIE